MQVQYNNDDVFFVIPAGQNGVSFSFDAYRRSGYSSESLTAYLEGRLSGVYPEIRQNQHFNGDASEADRAAWYQNRAVAFCASAVISGSVSFPSGARDVGATMELSAYSDEHSVSAYSYVSILKGQNSSPYRFTVPVCKLSQLELQMRSSTDGRASDDALRVRNDWSVSKDWGESPTVTGDRSGVNFALDVFSDAAKPEIVSVSAQSYSGQDGENVLEELRNNGRLYVVCAGPVGQTAAVFAVIYDSDGRFLDIDMNSHVNLRRSGQNASLHFDREVAANAAKVRVFLLDNETFSPLTPSRVF